MKRIIILFVLAIILLVSNFFTFFGALDCSMKTTYEDGGMYSYEDTLQYFHQITTNELYGETKEKIAGSLEKYKHENPEKNISMRIEKDSIVFNSSLYVFQDDKLVEVKAVDQNF